MFASIVNPKRALLMVPGSLISATWMTFLSAGNDWPQWSGPNRDGMSAEKGLLQAWPEAGPVLLWRASGLGSRFSSPVVSAGRIFTMGDV